MLALLSDQIRQVVENYAHAGSPRAVTLQKTVYVSVTPNSARQLTPEQQAVQQIPWQPTFKEEKVESTTKSQDLGDLTHT